MTKVELIAAVANEANLTKKDAEAAVNLSLIHIYPDQILQCRGPSG